MNPQKVLCTSLPLYGVVFYTLCHNLICDSSHFLPPNTTMSVLQKPQVCVRVGRFFSHRDYDTLSCLHITPIFSHAIFDSPASQTKCHVDNFFWLWITFLPNRTNCHEKSLYMWKKSRGWEYKCSPKKSDKKVRKSLDIWNIFRILVL